MPKRFDLNCDDDHALAVFKFISLDGYIRYGVRADLSPPDLGIPIIEKNYHGKAGAVNLALTPYAKATYYSCNFLTVCLVAILTQ